MEKPMDLVMALTAPEAVDHVVAVLTIPFILPSVLIGIGIALGARTQTS